MNYPSFLESELTEEQKTKGLFHVIPVPFEESVSYGSGTAAGPSAILEASSQLELWDGRGIPAERGIVTHEAITESPAQAMIDACSDKVFEVLESGSIPVTLGGEHTISVGPFKALEKWSRLHGKEVGIVQIDAHADLRESYEGSPLSHACIMRRAFDCGFPLYQIGVRSISPAEVEFRRRVAEEQPGRLGWIDAGEAVRGTVSSITLPDSFPKLIYLTIDIDGFDPSLFPATGTPEPGGLLWYQSLDMIESIARQGSIIGFDLVELAPMEGRNVDAFAAARLIYEIMGIVGRN